MNIFPKDIPFPITITDPEIKVGPKNETVSYVQFDLDGNCVSSIKEFRQNLEALTKIRLQDKTMY